MNPLIASGNATVHVPIYYYGYNWLLLAALHYSVLVLRHCRNDDTHAETEVRPTREEAHTGGGPTQSDKGGRPAVGVTGAASPPISVDMQFLPRWSRGRGAKHSSSTTERA